MAELDLASCTPVNDLWPALVERLGLERSARATRQALDLQAMRGQPTTLPVLMVDTCGVALVERELLRLSTGLPVPAGEGVLLLCSPRLQQLQLLQLAFS
ncbi:MAG: hypothetical protein ACKOGI_01385 [Vulcanococcus sp.]|nr:hypothetical protein [Cyanobacteria bacterium M_DeepCast_200m_mx_001]